MTAIQVPVTPEDSSAAAPPRQQPPPPDPVIGRAPPALGLNLRTLLDEMVAMNASDLHICAGQPPKLRIDGEMTNASTGGVLIVGLAAALMMTLPADFNLGLFAAYLFLMGAGMGFFSAPNTSQIMGSVPAEHRGSAAGMRSTVLNAGMTASQALFFTIVIGSLSHSLGPALSAGATRAGLPASIDQGISSLPPGAAIFPAMLGYDPISHLIPASVLSALPASIGSRVVDPHFFAGLLAQPFVTGIRAALLVCVGMCVLAGVTSALRGSDRPRPIQVRAPGGNIGAVSEPVPGLR